MIKFQVKKTKIAPGWIEAEWVSQNKEKVIYRLPDMGLSDIGIVVAYQLDKLNGGTAKTIHWHGFRYNVSRSAINRALFILKDAGYIKKSMNGRNTSWRLVKPIGVRCNHETN